MNIQAVSLANVGQYALERMSRELMRLIKQSPQFGQIVADIVNEELVRRQQGRDSLAVFIPVAIAAERPRVVNWSTHLREEMIEWGRQAPEFRADFDGAAQFLSHIARAQL